MDLYHSEVRDDFLRLYDAILENHTPDHIVLDIQNAQESLMAEEALECNYSVRDIAFHTRDLGAYRELPDGIYDYVKASQSLRKVNICFSTSFRFIDQFVQAIKQNPKINSLVCVLHQHHLRNITPLVDLLNNSRTLQSLSLAYGLGGVNYHTRKEQQLIEDAKQSLINSIAQKTTSLRTLGVVVRFEDEDDTTSRILNALPCDHPLEKIALQCVKDHRCSTQMKSYKALCAFAGKGRSNLRSIHLAGETPDRKWFLDLFHRLLCRIRNHRTIQSLTLENINMDPTKARQLRSLIRSTRTLKELNLYRLRIEGGEAQEQAFWSLFCEALIKNHRQQHGSQKGGRGALGSASNSSSASTPITSLALGNPHPFPRVQNMIHQCVWLGRLTISFEDEDAYLAVANVIAYHPTLHELGLYYQRFDRPAIQDLQPLTSSLSKNNRLHTLKLLGGFAPCCGTAGGPTGETAVVGYTTAPFSSDTGVTAMTRLGGSLVEHLSCDSCTLKHLELRNCEMSGIDGTNGFKSLLGALRFNPTLETLIVRQDYIYPPPPHDVSSSIEHLYAYRTWARTLVSSLKANQSLKHIEIPGFHVFCGKPSSHHPEKQLNALVAFYLLGNRYRPLIASMGNSHNSSRNSQQQLKRQQQQQQQRPALLSLIIHSLLQHDKVGRSVLFLFFKQRHIEL